MVSRVFDVPSFVCAFGLDRRRDRSGACRLLVLEDPTIGVDVGAKAQIYRMMAEDAGDGTSTVVVSSDLDELVQICDRVLAFSRGRIVAELARGDLTVEALTLAVSGAAAVAAPVAAALS